jgi:hypothetical protein
VTCVYDFTFPTVNLPFISNDIPTSPAYSMEFIFQNGYKGENIYAKRKTSIAIFEMTAWVNQFVMTTEEFL